MVDRGTSSMADIARRYISLSGLVTEHPYKASLYFVDGQDLSEASTGLQRDVFAFVADQDTDVSRSKKGRS